MPSFVIPLLALGGIFGTVVWLRRKRPVPTWSLPAAWGLVAVSFAILYPLASHHVFGMGSDREDALRVSIAALLKGRNPYLQRTYLGLGITPLPGAFLLAIPFYELGHVALQNLFWTACFIYVCAKVFSQRRTALAFVLWFVVLFPGGMQDLVTGGDYVVNAMYVVCLMVAVTWAFKVKPERSWRWAVPVLLGVALASRLIYFVAYPCTFAYLWRAGLRKSAVAATTLMLLTAGGLSLPFYLWNPDHFTPLTAGTFSLAVFPAALHARVLLPLLGAAVACTGFIFATTPVRLVVLLGASLASILVPVFVADSFFRPELFPSFDLVYLAPICMLVAMGLFSLTETAC